MNKEVFISVIIPTYNRAHLITDAIDSVINQSYKNFELIVVDDHSTDNTKQIMQNYADQRIHFVINQRVKGAPGARNTGLYSAKGDWVQFLDSDDVLLPEKLNEQVKKIDKNTSIIAGDYKEIRPNNQERIIQSIEDVWIALYRSKLGITSSNLFRKDILIEIGGWNEELRSSQEYDLMFRIMKAGGGVKIDRSVNTVINIGSSSISKSEDDQRLYEILSTRFKLRDQIQQYLTEAGLYTETRRLECEKYLYDQLWFSRYRHPKFFHEQMRKRKFKISVNHKIQRIIKSKIRYLMTNFK